MKVYVISSEVCTHRIPVETLHAIILPLPVCVCVEREDVELSKCLRCGYTIYDNVYVCQHPAVKTEQDNGIVAVSCLVCPLGCQHRHSVLSALTAQMDSYFIACSRIFSVSHSLLKSQQSITSFCQEITASENEIFVPLCIVWSHYSPKATFIKMIYDHICWPHCSMNEQIKSNKRALN